MSDCSTNAFKPKQQPKRNRPHPHNLTKSLRDGLDTMGIKWKDGSEEVYAGDVHYLMERTYIMYGDTQVASCIWGHSGTIGQETASTAGYPDKFEVASSVLDASCEPMTAEEIVKGLVG